MTGTIGRAVGDFFRGLFSVGILTTYVLIPLVVLSLYLLLASLGLPAGVNDTFATRSARFFVPVSILVIGVVALVRFGRGRGLQVSSARREGLTKSDLILLLLPLTPVVQYILRNEDILSWAEALAVIGFFALLASVPIFVVPALLRNTAAARPVMYLGLAFMFLLTSMASLSRQFAWHESGSLRIQLALFAGIWLFSWLLWRLRLEGLLHIAIAAWFVSTLVVGFVPDEDPSADVDQGRHENELVERIGSSRPKLAPNIYLLVYDSYVANETMLAYGIDNHDHERFLEELGFKLYPSTYSVGASTMTSMSRVLESSLEFIGDGRRAVAGHGAVNGLLEGLGYQTYGVFPAEFFFRGTTPGYDYSFPEIASPTKVLIEAILEGEFRFNIGFDEFTREQFLRERNSIFSGGSEQPRFVYTHSDLPGHSETMSGVCLPNEVQLFGERLVKANQEMREDLGRIIENDPGAIVIVAGDHGPRLTKNCIATGNDYEIGEITRLDIQDRYGTFLAIRWPSADSELYDEITVLQDVFPAVFAYMFDDPGLLAARVEPVTREAGNTSGAKVEDGVIVGGMDDGEPLFAGGGK